MTHRCILSVISFILYSFTSFAQNALDTTLFYNHLKKNHLWTEQITFNKQLQNVYSNNHTIMDSLQLDLALLYHQLHLLDSSKNILLRMSTQALLSENNNKNYCSLLMIYKQFHKLQQRMDSSLILMPEIYRKENELSIKILNRTLSQTDSQYFDMYSISPVILDIKNKYIHHPHYSVVLAGTYSALIPGLGKWYIGNKKQALSAFIMNTLLAAQAIESYSKVGVKTARFIITSSLFGIFYTGNIIGSMAMAKKKKRDYLKQLDYEIYNYYGTTFN